MGIAEATGRRSYLGGAQAKPATPLTLADVMAAVADLRQQVARLAVNVTRLQAAASTVDAASTAASTRQAKSERQARWRAKRKTSADVVRDHTDDMTGISAA
jgi:hypothetical protein